MRPDPAAARQFTGRHMLAIMVAFFGVIVAVNVTMATLANTSWTGFVVKNSYIASQQFNRKAEEGRRQAALGWDAELALAEGRLRFALADAQGRTVAMPEGTATFRRPASDREDVTVALVPSGGALEGSAELADGVWIVEVLADAGQEAPFRETRRLHVRGGTAR